MLAPYASCVAERLAAGQKSRLCLYEDAGEVFLSYPSTPLSSIATAKVGTKRARKLASIARRLGAMR